MRDDGQEPAQLTAPRRDIALVEVGETEEVHDYAGRRYPYTRQVTTTASDAAEKSELVLRYTVTSSPAPTRQAPAETNRDTLLEAALPVLAVTPGKFAIADSSVLRFIVAATVPTDSHS